MSYAKLTNVFHYSHAFYVLNILFLFKRFTTMLCCWVIDSSGGGTLLLRSGVTCDL